MARVTRTAVRMASKREVSPKVALPAIAQLVVGAVLVILGAVPQIVQDGDVREKLLSLGLGLIGASGLTGSIGFAARPGRVVVND